MTEIERIQTMETAFNELSSAHKALVSALDGFVSHLEQWKALSAYYGSDAFHHDLALDEAGKLPCDLRRGVLSEDAVYDLMTDLAELVTEMHSVAETINSHIGAPAYLPVES